MGDSIEGKRHMFTLNAFLNSVSCLVQVLMHHFNLAQAIFFTSGSIQDTIKCTEAWLILTFSKSFSGETNPQKLISTVIWFSIQKKYIFIE